MTEEAISAWPVGNQAMKVHTQSLQLTRGRHTPDERQLKTRRKGLKIGTWNVRTLYKVGQFENLKAEITALNLDILGIAETRWNDD